MEHQILIENSLKPLGLRADKRAVDFLYAYAVAVYEESRKYNLTGFKTETDIIKQLILKSLEPFSGADVPRGTSFCDLGSGAGIPGIPVGIVFESMKGVLLESSDKKTSFIKRIIDDLNLENLSVCRARAEEFGILSENRENFDLILSRAMAPEYAVMEYSAPILRVGGILYIYSNKSVADLLPEHEEHAKRLGLIFSNPFKMNVSSGGLVFEKISKTQAAYPRKYATIKRESAKITGEEPA